MGPRAPARSTGPSSTGDAAVGEARGRGVDPSDDDEAQVGAAGGGAVGVRGDRGVGGVEVDLLVAQAQCGAPPPEGHDVHPQDVRVEVDGGLDGGDGEDYVVDTGDAHTAIVPL